MIGRNDPCWCGSGRKWKKCCTPKMPPGAEGQQLRNEYWRSYQIHLKNDKEMVGIRRACKLTAEILDATCAMAKAGVTTNELNDFAHRLHDEAGAVPAPLGYGDPPYPKSICTSLNEVICHGIPNDEPLVDGDILNIDVSLTLDGFCGDTSRMVVVGETSEEKQHVVDVAYECLMRGIAVCKPGVEIRAIGEAISDYAESQGCSVVHQFVGHGIGTKLHEAPQVPHSRNNVRIPLAPGMTFTIEPMINIGKSDAVMDAQNHWEARTVDGKPSAQWEHQLLITDSSVEILTDWG